MKQFIIPFFALFAISSCKSKSSTEKEATKDSITVKTDTSAKATNTVTKKLIFDGYEEGDYAHLVFTDADTKESYDVGHPTENELGAITVVIADTTTSFGFRENPKAVGTTYTATLEKRMVNTYDGNGQPIRAEGWRIVSISQ